MKLAGLHGEHVEAGRGAMGNERGNVVAADFKTGHLIVGDRRGLVRGLGNQGGKAEKVAVSRLVDEDFLLILVGGDDPHASGHDDIGVVAGTAGFEDALAWSKVANLDLSGEDSGLIVIEEFEKRDVAEFFGIAGHGGFSLFSG
jgi:hypothetical protein